MPRLLSFVVDILFLMKMKLAFPARVGLGLVGVGLAAFLAVAIWMKTVRTTLADIPMPMRAETVGRDFTVDYDGPIYSMDVMFDRSVPEAHARCLLGATKSEIRPELDCSRTAPLLKFTWELRRDGQFAGSGSSADMGSSSTADGALRVGIVGFPARKKHQYHVALKFDENAGELTILAPRVQVELDSFAREDLSIAGALLDAIAFVLCLVGVAMVAVPFLRTKFSRLKTLPGPR